MAMEQGMGLGAEPKHWPDGVTMQAVRACLLSITKIWILYVYLIKGTWGFFGGENKSRIKPPNSTSKFKMK